MYRYRAQTASGTAFAKSNIVVIYTDLKLIKLRGNIMKKSIMLFLVMTLLMGSLVFSASAQSTYYRKVVRNGRVTWVRTRKPSYYRRHRNRVNMAVGTGAGALIGGLIGGGKGAAIGAGSGLAGSALYTYKLKKKKRHYRKVRRY